MSDAFMDLARILLIGALVFLILQFGRRNALSQQKGWTFFVFGLGLVLFGGIWDFLRNFEQISPYFMVGGVNLRFIFENFLGYLAGLLFIMIGLIRWLPNIELSYSESRKIDKMEESLRDARARFDRGILQKSDELSETYQALHESEAKLSAFMKHAKAAIGLKDAEGRYIAVNPVSEKNFRMSASQILGRLPSEIFPSDVSVQLEEQDKIILETGETLVEEVSGDVWGAHRTFLTEKFPISTPSGHVIGIGAISTEITAQKVVEASLEKSERRYRSLFEQSPIPFMEEDWTTLLETMRALSQSGVSNFEDHFAMHPSVVEDLYNGCVRSAVSKSMIELYGAETVEELERELLHEFADQNELEGFSRAVVALFQGAREFGYQANEHKVDGTPIVTQIKFSLPREYASNWKRVLVSVEDITNRVAVEEKMRVSQKFEAIGQLSGGIAHDFNNLLAVMQGCGELLEDAQEYDARLVRDILSATKRGANLTHRLLAYSRQQILAPKEIDLAVLVNGMQDMLKRTLGETIEVHANFDRDLWQARADPGQVEDALLNLAINARDAMPSGGSLEIKCMNVTLNSPKVTDETELLSGEYVVLAVTDTGFGMSENTLSRVFEPFFTTKDVGDGSGLGLSMVYGFARQSGGHVNIESNVNEGTTVSVYLPKETKAAQSPKESEHVDVPLGKGETVLVIEDDLALRQMIVRMTRGLGYRPVSAGNAAEAREILSEGQEVDLILSDVVLPGGTNGPDFATELRAQNSSLKILFMSGYPNEAFESELGLNAACIMLAKPFQRDALAQALYGTLATR